jgi:pectate lyase
VERDNVYIHGGKPEVRGTVAEPHRAYDYTLDRPADISTIVKNGAGVGKVGLWRP